MGRGSAVTEGPTVLDTVEDPSVTDPLTEVSRRERKALLAACITGLAISAGGLVPERIETFGITVNPQQEESLLYLLAGVIGYFLAAFSIYAWSDLKRRATVAARHRKRLRPLIEAAVATYRKTQGQLKSRAPEGLSQTFSEPEFLRLAGMADQMKFAQRVQRAGAIRISIDIYFPIVAGATSIVVVWSSTGGFPGWPSVGLGALTSAVVAAAAGLWWRRRDLRRWWRKRRHTRRSLRQKELMQKAQALAPDDPRKTELLSQARELLMKTLDDMKDGIF